ncbi:hypothetical protein [Thiofilum flexile]|uniref:hypothetical protein n=1 Tax=Thiofilum flexile TaxID=125627 RepID=UPI00036D1DC5|nr:hypothetical protein [Thiofilum flexile]
MKTVASLRYGVIFKKAFSRPDIFTAFVRDILGIEIQIDHVETEKSFEHPIGSVDSRFDLFAEDKVNRIIVDIQHRRYLDHYHRFLHYHCAALLEQSVNAKDYRPNTAVYTIVVLTSGDKHQKDMLAIDFDPKDWDGVGISEIPHKILFLNPKYLNERTPEPWREWLRAINDSLDGQVNEAEYHNACVQKVLKLIEQDQITPAEYARMKDEYSEEQLRFKEWEEALENTLEKGKQLGLEEGLEKGERLGRMKTAQTMLAKGMTVDLVAELTGLSVEQIQSLT